jgi:hypothetical protein
MLRPIAPSIPTWRNPRREIPWHVRCWLSPMVHMFLVSGFEFRVSSFGFRVSGFGLVMLRNYITNPTTWELPACQKHCPAMEECDARLRKLPLFSSSTKGSRCQFYLSCGLA